MSTNTTAPPGGTGSNATGTTAGGSGGSGNRNAWRGRRGRSGQEGRAGRGSNTTRRTNDANSFKGTIKDMNGHVFQCYGEGTASNQFFARTLEELDGYVGLHFKHNPADIKKMIRKMTDTVFDMPPAPEPTPGTTETATATISASAQVFWKQEVDMYFREKNMYDNNKCALCTVVIWSQCSEAMQQAKVKSHDGYDAMYETSDSLALINVIKGIADKFESQKNM
jgi:hypothetical protein